MSARGAVVGLENILRRMLDRRFGQRPYRRVNVENNGDGTGPRLWLSVEPSVPPVGSDPSLALWTCRISITPSGQSARFGLEVALEVIDLLHGADVDGEDIILIDITFRSASMGNWNLAPPQPVILLFDISTVENDDVDSEPVSPELAVKRAGTLI